MTAIGNQPPRKCHFGIHAPSVRENMVAAACLTLSMVLRLITSHQKPTLVCVYEDRTLFSHLRTVVWSRLSRFPRERGALAGGGIVAVRHHFHPARRLECRGHGE